jgi:hypothetical protein
MTKNFRALAFIDFYGRPSMNAGEIGTFDPADDGFRVLIERGLIEVLPDTPVEPEVETSLDVVADEPAVEPAETTVAEKPVKTVKKATPAKKSVSKATNKS